MKTSCYSDIQILTILKQVEAGTLVPKLCREHGMSSATFYKWRSKYGGMDASLVARMKELEDENRRLKDVRRGATQGRDRARSSGKKMAKPSCRREMARRSVSERGTTIRVACMAFSISRTYYGYRPKLSDENADIDDRLIRLTDNRRTWRFGLCFLYLPNIKSFGWNHLNTDQRRD